MRLNNDEIYPAPASKQEHLDKLREYQNLKWPQLYMRGLANELGSEMGVPTTVLRFVSKGGELLTVGVIKYKDQWLFLSGVCMENYQLIEHLNKQGWRWASLT